ncbi:MAG: mechanosensitive ion channel [Candidatus Promineifilaceae bacterium]|nr:mechanosensitive ion channel [Candidatus Promineifilaceae bacterium]
MEQIQSFLSGPIGQLTWNLLIAIVILIVGYIVARIIASIVRRLLKRTKIDDRIADTLSEPEEERRWPIEDVVAKITFWILMLFVIVAALEQVNITGISEPLSAFLNSLTTVYLPRLFGAGVLLLVAWLVATALRFLVRKGLGLLNFDKRMSRYGAIEEGEQVTFVEPLATAVFWFTFLLFLPSVLAALGLVSLAEMGTRVFDDIVGYLPSIFAAVVIGFIGWILARIIRQIVTSLLVALGVDKFGDRIGLSAERSLAEILGNILYIIILFLVIIAALGALNIPAISDPVTLMLTQIISFIPGLLGAVILLVLAYLIGRVVANLVRDLLANTGFDALPAKLGLSWSATNKPSAWAGSLVLIVIMIFAATSAAEILGSQFLVDALDVFITFLWQAFLAAVIFAFGLYFARLAYGIIYSTGMNNANFLARAAQVAIIVFAGAIALGELGIARNIIDLAFGISFGAIALAAVLAFGLGSREIAGREVEKFVADMRTPDAVEGPADTAGGPIVTPDITEDDQ